MPQILLTSDGIGSAVPDTILNEVVSYAKSGKLTWTAIILVSAAIVWIVFKNIVKQRTKNFDKRSQVVRNAKIVSNIVKIALGFIVVILILQVNGINITSLVAGLSLTSVVVGFALQSLLADWISGLTIVSEHFYGIGDVVKIGDNVGRVVNVNLKVTILEDMLTGNRVSINNHLVDKAEVLSDRLDMEVPISYEMSVEDTSRFMKELCDEVGNMEAVKSCEFRGIQDYGESIIYERIRVVVKDIVQRWQVKRDVQTLIREKYQAWNISIPYNRMDVCIVGGDKDVKAEK